MPTATDLHFHLLPGIDDGPADPAAAVALARAAVAAGTATVVATPHVSWRWPDNDATRIADALALLRRDLAVNGVPLEVRGGAEVALTRAVDLPQEELERLRLAGGPWLLLECPSDAPPGSLEVLLRRLMDDGHRLLLAHPERIPAFREEPALLTQLVGGGARCQVTAGAFAGGFGKEVRRFSHWMLGAGLVHVAASDAHAPEGRTPALERALADAGLAVPLARWLTHEAPAALLVGEDPGSPPPTTGRPPGRVRRLLRRSPGRP